MYSLEEAEKELALKEEGQADEVVHTLPSFKAPLSFKKLRQPSFFQKMFSSSKLNRVHSEYFAFPESEVQNTKEYFREADGDVGKSGKRSRKEKKKQAKDLDDMDMDTIATEEQDKRLLEAAEEQKDYSSSSSKSKRGKRSRRKTRDNLSDISEEITGEDENQDNSLDDKQIYEIRNEPAKPDYPLMPIIGKPVNIDRLINRTKAAASGIRYLMEMIENDVAQSEHRAKSIPVSKELDRVQVTPQISAVAAKVQSTAQVKKVVESNMVEIQRNLNYRKSALIMMNVNYANQRVRKIDPIYVQEARTIVTYK